MDRYAKLQQFVSMLDQKHAMRLIVLLAPGMVATKLASYAQPGSPFGSLAVALLGAGMVIYFSWGYLKKKLLGDAGSVLIEDELPADDAPASAPVVPGEVHVVYMRELVDMCNGDAAQAIQLVAIESQMHPREDYLAAIAYAHRRKSFLVKRQSGN